MSHPEFGRSQDVVAALAFGCLGFHYSSAPRSTQAAPPGRSGPEQSDEVTVTTRGQGATGSAAKDEAVREALRRAVGMFVDVKTETYGEKIVSDRILSGTGALVLGSKVVAGPTRRAQGSHEVECAVRIRKGTLVGQLAAAGFKVTGSMDGDAAARVAATKLRSAEEAEALLRERLSGLWSKLFVARIIDGKGIPLGDGEVPDVKQLENGNVAVVAVVQVYFHLEAFYPKFLPDLQALLDALASSRRERTANRDAWGREQPRTEFGNIPVHAGGCLDDLALGSGLALFVSVGRDQTALDEQFVGYSSPPALGAVIQNASEAAARCALRVELLTQDGKAVAAVTVQADQLTNAGTNNFPGAGLLLGHPFGPPRYLLSPTMYFRTHPGGQRVPRQDCPQPFATTCDVLEGRIPIVLPAADLQNVKTYPITPVEG